MTNDFGELVATDIVAGLRSGSIPVDAYAEYISQRVKDLSSLNSVQSFDPNHLLVNMKNRLAECSGSLIAGLPIIVKDNINTLTFPTSGGTRALLDNTPDENAPVVQQISEAGGVIGAKAGMHELAFGITSNNAVTGAIKNPHDETLIAGGSSGGAAVAVAAGIFPVGLGTDTGGSCRIPASLCGTVGFRPSTGRYCGKGVVPISHTLDTVGTLARCTADIALLDQVLTGDKSSLRDDISGLRLGIPRKRFFENLDASVEVAVTKELGRLEAAGAILIDISLESIWNHAEAFSIPVALYEVIRDLPKYLAKHAPDISFEMLVANIGSPDVKGFIESQLGDDAIPLVMYSEAMTIHRPAMLRIYNAVFQDNALDAIAFPTTPLTARPIGQDTTVELNGVQVPTFSTYIRNTDLAPNIGAPGISLPCQQIDGLPVGLEFDGLPGMDNDLLSLAMAAEHILTR